MKKLGFRAMRLPVFDRDDPKTIDIEQVKRMVDSFLEQGFTYFDTAYPYHGETSELAIRAALDFGLLNLYAVTGNKTNMYYQRFSMNHGKASECLKCGLCENICPQHIGIRSHMEEFKTLYEPGV